MPGTCSTLGTQVEVVPCGGASTALRLLSLIAAAVFSSSVFGQEFVWTQTTAPKKQWQFVTSSSDGIKLMAAANSATAIYHSTNSGLTWRQAAAPAVTQWSCGASSSDGSKLAAGVGNNVSGTIYTSADSGLTWTQSSAPSQSWSSIASSFDGTKLVGTAGGLFVSTNSGATWTESSAPDSGAYCVASSSDGTKLFAGVNPGWIYISTNSGLTWMNTDAPSNHWYSLACSFDGTRLAAVVFGGGIYTSTNSGVVWTQTTAPITNWFRIVSSADGTRLAALGPNVGIYTSTNSGVSWVASSTPPNTGWSSIASSSDGNKLVAVSQYGQIYTANWPPQILAQPLSLPACTGSSPVFRVTATGEPPLSYQWRKGGTNLVDGGNVRGSTTAELALSNVSQSDATTYDVVITNNAGSITSSVVTLTLTLVPAKAVPVVVNGFIVGAIVTDGGCGYTNSPVVFLGL